MKNWGRNMRFMTKCFVLEPPQWFTFSQNGCHNAVDLNGIGCYLAADFTRNVHSREKVIRWGEASGPVQNTVR